uniref:Uncharacterized protein n=1 Tax=Meloidogyne hapla TaxID=6305 RepID=A0A1I8BKR5_MELHA
MLKEMRELQKKLMEEEERDIQKKLQEEEEKELKRKLKEKSELQKKLKEEEEKEIKKLKEEEERKLKEKRELQKKLKEEEEREIKRRLKDEKEKEIKRKLKEKRELQKKLNKEEEEKIKKLKEEEEKEQQKLKEEEEMEIQRKLKEEEENKKQKRSEVNAVFDALNMAKDKEIIEKAKKTLIKVINIWKSRNNHKTNIMITGIYEFGIWKIEDVEINIIINNKLSLFSKYFGSQKSICEPMNKSIPIRINENGKDKINENEDMFIVLSPTNPEQILTKQINPSTTKIIEKAMLDGS